MNLTSTALRNRLTIKHTSNLLFIQLVGPEVNKWKPIRYVKSWLRKHLDADTLSNNRRDEKLAKEDESESGSGGIEMFWQALNNQN
jgi:hypothetical protein